ncbi:alpha/beta fold hydrolase, partial [Rhodococcus sp. EPR-147]
MPHTTPAGFRRKDEERRRWPKPVMAAAAALLLLAGCSGAASNDYDSANRVGLERFMEQEFAFGACDASVVDSQPPVPQVVEAAEKAECAMLTVPMDYEDLDGETIEIAVSRISATGDNPIGSVLLNPGGPGAAGTTVAPLVNALWAGGPIPERFDIVGFDPRGVGLSNPAIDCYSDEERDADAPLSALGTWTEESARAIVDKCADGSGTEEVLAHLGTRDVARDMDVLRAVLGDDKLTYAGVSYGTRLGSVYAEMFPENVRALVLDGAVDPLMDTADRRIQLSEGVQASFQRFADFCMTQAACPLGTDPAQATAAAQELLQPLEEEPLVAADGREVGFLAAG